MQQDLTEGPITRHIVSMAAFIGAGLLFQTLYFLVDLYFVSRLGSAAIAGVSTAGAVFFLIMGFSQLVGVGAMALIAQAMGAKDQKGADRFSNQAMSLSLAMMGVALVLLYTAGGAVVSKVAADEPTAQAARDYLFAFAPGLALMFPSAALGASLRAAGVVGPPMMVQTGGVLLNVVLAPILIAGWLTGVPLGVAGAGWASTIASVAGMTAMFLIFPRVQTTMRFHGAALRPKLDVWGRIATVGLPATGEFLLMFVISGVVYWVIRDFGAHAQAGFGVGSRIMQSIFLPVMAVAFAAAPIAGQNYGAKNAARVRETFQKAALICAGLMLLMTLFAHWRPDLMLKPFTDDREALAVAEEYLSIASWSFIAAGVNFTCSSMFQGLGDTRPSLIASASRLITFAAPALWIASQPFASLKLVWTLSVASTFAQTIISFLLLRWQLRVKLGPAPAPA